MSFVYVVTCPVCHTQNVTDEPGTEKKKEQDGAPIECTQCGSMISAHGGQVRDFSVPVVVVEEDLFMLDEL